MLNTSIKLPTPCELINVTPVNPLISKCQIKVCWVGEQPNRNKSIITKEVARELANSLPGSPIVGFFNEETQDFEGHERAISIKDGKFEFKDITRPYGFIDLNAKVWFQWFSDNGVEHEYLVTEGWLWTGQYPECQRIIDKGNNQSMELDDKLIDATWTKDGNGKNQFFIINEGIISKLCILGEEVEPCFEGSQITKVQFSFEDDFKTQLFSMISEIKNMLDKGGASMFTTYAVEIGDSLWSALYSYIEETYPDGECCYCSVYRIEGIYEEGEQKFAILQNRSDMKYYRLNFSVSETEGFAASADLEDVTKTFTPAETAQFAPEAVEEFAKNYAAQKEADKKEDDDEEICPECGKPVSECECEKEKEEDEDDKNKFAETCPKCGKPIAECTCDEEDEDEDEDKKDKYNLDEIPEYIELRDKYAALETDYNSVCAARDELLEFRKGIEKKEKQAMIDNFYMLSDDDKKDVIDNIDTYSLDDIEAKLSIICVRNKVSFEDLDNNKKEDNQPTIFNLNDSDYHEDVVPAWIKAIQATAKQ